VKSNLGIILSLFKQNTTFSYFPASQRGRGNWRTNFLLINTTKHLIIGQWGKRLPRRQVFPRSLRNGDETKDETTIQRATIDNADEIVNFRRLRCQMKLNTWWFTDTATVSDKLLRRIRALTDFGVGSYSSVIAEALCPFKKHIRWHLNRHFRCPNVSVHMKSMFRLEDFRRRVNGCSVNLVNNGWLLF